MILILSFFFVSVFTFIFSKSLFTSLIILETLFVTAIYIILSYGNSDLYIIVVLILGLGVIAACTGLTLIIKRVNN